MGFQIPSEVRAVKPILQAAAQTALGGPTGELVGDIVSGPLTRGFETTIGKLLDTVAPKAAGPAGRAESTPFSTTDLDSRTAANPLKTLAEQRKDLASVRESAAGCASQEAKKLFDLVDQKLDQRAQAQAKAIR